MPPAPGQSQRSPTVPGGAGISLGDLILLRIAAGGATRVDLQRDVAPLLAPQTNGTEFRRAAELAISTLSIAQFVREDGGRLSATPKGAQVASTVAVAPKAGFTVWKDARSALSMRALAVPDTPANRKALERGDSLAALILQKHFKLAASRPLSLVDLRGALSILALERAFGNRIKTGLGKGLPAKAARLLAGQLLRQPREFSSDGKLIMALAAETLGARDTSAEAIELALLRTLTQREPPAASVTTPVQQPRRNRLAQTPKPANDRTPLAAAEPMAARTAEPPDLTEFVTSVLDAARPVAEGWPGNKKAFISLVWKAIRHARPDWGLSEIAFKGMLAEAHRSGRLELATADLKVGRDLKSLEESRILYKNTVWHFVRVLG